VVDAEDHGRIDVITARRGNQHLAGTARQMRARLGLAREESRALEDDVDAELPPRQLGRIALREHADTIAVDDHRVALNAHLTVEATMSGVVSRQMRIGVGIAEIVDGDDLDLAGAAAFIKGAQYVAADAAIAVDAYLDRHLFNLLIWVR